MESILKLWVLSGKTQELCFEVIAFFPEIFIVIV
jgi:hypothetical protein